MKQQQNATSVHRRMAFLRPKLPNEQTNQTTNSLPQMYTIAACCPGRRCCWSMALFAAAVPTIKKQEESEEEESEEEESEEEESEEEESGKWWRRAHNTRFPFSHTVTVENCIKFHTNYRR